MKNKKLTLIIEITLFILALIGITFIYYFNGKEINEEEKNNVGIITITNENFETEVINSDKPVILEFTSNMCPPCITMLPTLINIAKNNQDIKVATINHDDENTKTISDNYNVQATPTIIVFKNGEVIDIIIGASNEENILKELKGE